MKPTKRPALWESEKAVLRALFDLKDGELLSVAETFRRTNLGNTSTARYGLQNLRDRGLAAEEPSGWRLSAFGCAFRLALFACSRPIDDVLKEAYEKHQRPPEGVGETDLDFIWYLRKGHPDAIEEHRKRLGWTPGVQPADGSRGQGVAHRPR